MATPQEIRSYVTGVLGNENMSPMDMTRNIQGAAQQYGVGAGQIAQNSPLSMQDINMNLGQAGLTLEGANPYQAANQTANRPQYGLSGTEAALREGGQEARGILQQTGEQVTGTFNRGVEGFLPFMEQGQGANQLQAAQTGALGPEAQAQAFEDYQASPYVDQAQQNAERAITRNAAATGGARGGNVLDQLYQNAAGMFMQDFGNQFQRAGQVADRGFGATQGVGNLSSQLGGIQANLGSQEAQIPMDVASQLGQYRFQTGRDIASQTQQATSALANLQSQQGAGTSDLIGQQATQLQNLYTRASEGDAQAKEQLGTILSNLSSQTGSQYASQQIVPGAQSNLLGRFGQAASGIGGLLEYMPENQGDA